MTRDIAAFREYFCVISRMTAIHELRQGILSIDKELISKGCCLKKYFIKDEMTKVTLDDSRGVIQFEPGSNEYTSCEDSIIEFELFLASLECNECDGLQLKEFLIFAAGVDRMPVFGLPKKKRGVFC